MRFNTGGYNALYGVIFTKKQRYEVDPILDEVYTVGYNALYGVIFAKK